MPEATGNPVGRDPALIRSQLPLGRLVTGYFSPELRGIANVPVTGPVLLVGNRSGMYYMPDAWVAGMALAERRGIEQPTYSLAYDLLFRVPAMGSYLRRLGVVPAPPKEPAGPSRSKARPCWSTQGGTTRHAGRGRRPVGSTSAATTASCDWPSARASRSSRSWATGPTTPSWCCGGGPASPGPSGWAGCASGFSRSSSAARSASLRY